MSLSVRTFLERIRPTSRRERDMDWFARGVTAHGKHQYLKALGAWKRGSALGDTESDYRIGLLYARGEGVVRSAPDAVTWYRRAAEAGHAEAQFQLGLIYLHGANCGAVGLDNWFAAASQQNSDAAQQTLNMLFPHGIAVEKDLDVARRWIWAAAAAGKVEAQAVLGEIYRHGLGVIQDYGEAQRWYWLAAQQGIASAQFAMGDLYYQGLGVLIDHSLAADWYELAAKNGDARAQVALASTYLAGQGRPADRKKAGGLFVQAAEQNEARGLYHAALMHLKGDGLPENIDKAETYLRRSAKQNYHPAIISLAQFYAHGNGIEPDLREAAVWYLKAAEFGDVQSQFIVGRFYATGSGVPSNLQESARWFLRAAEQGNPTAAHNIATYYAKGTGVERDLTKALEWYHVAAASDITASQVQLGKMYSVGDGVPRDRKRAVDWLEKAAQSGDPEAKTALAMLHLQDEGTARNTSRAEELLKEAAEGGHAAAAMELGHLYSGRYSVEAKSGDAISWYTKAAEAGAIEAQHTLGMLYLNGRGVQKDLATAASWIEKAAHNGHGPSQFQLAVLYCTAQGVPKDLASAVTWYEQAAERGHPLAQYNLAVMLSKGQGCEADEARATVWFQKAAEQGVAEARRALAGHHRDRPRPPDDTTGRSLDQNTSSESATPSMAPEGTSSATAQTSSPANQPGSNKMPSHEPASVGTTPLPAAPQPPLQTRTAPQKVARQDSLQDDPNHRKRDPGLVQNGRRLEGRGENVTQPSKPHSTIESPHRGPSDVPPESRTADNAERARSPGIDPEESAPGGRSQREPAVTGKGAMTNSSQVEKSGSTNKTGGHPAGAGVFSKHLKPSGNSPNHRTDRTEVLAESKASPTPRRPEDPARPAARASASSADVPTAQKSATNSQLSMQVNDPMPDAATSLANASLPPRTDVRLQAIPPKSMEEVGSQSGRALDDDLRAQTSLSSTDGKAGLKAPCGPNEGSGLTRPERRETNDQEAVARAMSDIGNQLREAIHSDLDRPPPLSADRLDGTATGHRHLLGLRGSDAVKLLGRLEQVAVPLESKRSPRIDTRGEHDDTALKDVARAMAELEGSLRTAGVPANSPSDRRTARPDTPHASIPKREPAETNTAGLSRDKRSEGKFGESAIPGLASGGASGSAPLGMAGHASNVVPREGLRSSAHPLNYAEAALIAAPRSGGGDAAVELARAVAELGTAPVSPRTNLAARPHTDETHRAVERSDEAAHRPTSDRDRPPKEADFSPEGRRWVAAGMGPTPDPIAGQSKSHQNIESFLTDLTRQLDGIDFRSGRQSKP
jgi:uncharacterized protein